MTQFFSNPEKLKSDIGNEIFAYDRDFFNDANFVMQRLHWRKKMRHSSDTIVLSLPADCIGMQSVLVRGFFEGRTLGTWWLIISHVLEPFKAEVL